MNPKTGNSFGSRVNAARAAREMSVADVARSLAVRPDTVADWENDRTEPRANKVLMLAGVLGVSPGWLLEGTGFVGGRSDGTGSNSDVGPEGGPNGEPQGDSQGDLQAELDELRRLAMVLSGRLERLAGRIG